MKEIRFDLHMQLLFFSWTMEEHEEEAHHRQINYAASFLD
jgi:hypothetical protein